MIEKRGYPQMAGAAGGSLFAPVGSVRSAWLSPGPCGLPESGPSAASGRAGLRYVKESRRFPNR